MSQGIWQARREWHNIFKVLNWKKMAAKNTLPSKALIQNRRKDKQFSKQKLNKFMITKWALREIFKGTLWVERIDQKLQRQERIKKLSRNNKTSNKMTINTYLSINILNVNGLNAPIKRLGYQNRSKQNKTKTNKQKRPVLCCLQDSF